MAPVMPAITSGLTRKGSSGIIPQDVLRSMDPKDVQKVVSSTVIASRVYKVLDTDQLESLKKVSHGKTTNQSPGIQLAQFPIYCLLFQAECVVSKQNHW